MSMHEILFEERDAFIRALRERSITTVVYAVIDEKRCVPLSTESVSVERVHSAEALAYHDAVILKYRAQNDAVEETELYLAQAGFAVARRSRNII